jgi:hypothetical protein
MMSGFWIAGIGINAIGLIALIYWGVKNWRRSDSANGSDGKDRGDAR